MVDQCFSLIFICLLHWILKCKWFLFHFVLLLWLNSHSVFITIFFLLNFNKISGKSMMWGLKITNSFGWTVPKPNLQSFPILELFAILLFVLLSNLLFYKESHTRKQQLVNEGSTWRCKLLNKKTKWILGDKNFN